MNEDTERDERSSDRTCRAGWVALGQEGAVSRGGAGGPDSRCVRCFHTTGLEVTWTAMPVVGTVAQQWGRAPGQVQADGCRFAPNSSCFLDPQTGMGVASWWWDTQTAWSGLSAGKTWARAPITWQGSWCHSRSGCWRVR